MDIKVEIIREKPFDTQEARIVVGSLHTAIANNVAGKIKDRLKDFESEMNNDGGGLSVKLNADTGEITVLSSLNNEELKDRVLNALNNPKMEFKLKGK